MRILSMLLVAGCLAIPLTAKASPVVAPALDSAASTSIEDVAGRCGRHAHYVPRHRNSRGHWVGGRCVHN